MYASFSQDGKYVLGACGDNTIFVWDVEIGSTIQILKGHTRGALFAAFTLDGKHIISASQDSTIRRWYFPPLQELNDQTRERFKDRPLTSEERRMYYLE